MADLAPGSTFADHVILAVAGRGGMGVVYRAMHEPLQRQVALKLIVPELSADEEFRSRFQTECRAAASIRHPNVIPIYHAGEESGRLYVSMPYVDGPDLGRVLAMAGRLDAPRAARLVADLAEGLQVAHGLGIVHRDVKPANVLIEWRGDEMHPLLTDFGLAKTVRDAGVTTTGAILGTLDYAAPEQLEGRAIDGRTDVYALGCLLFHVLTGRVPYPRAAATAKIVAHLGAPPPSVADLAPDVPQALGLVVRRALAKDPDDRYASATAFGQAALAAAGPGAPAAGPPLTATIAPGVPSPGVPSPGVRPPGVPSPGVPLSGVPVGDVPPRGVPLPGARSPGVPSPGGRAAGAVPAADRRAAFPAPLATEERRTPFVGRRLVMERLAERYARVQDAEPQFVTLAGEPGVGKTRVAAEFARRAHADGATILYGRSDAESIVPYQPFITAIQHYLADAGEALARDLDLELAELGRFIPGLRRDARSLVEPLVVEADAKRYRLFQAVTRVLAFIAAERPVVLILDDLHWADTSTALLLRHVVQQLHDVRLLLLGTMRDSEPLRAGDLEQLLARLRPQGSFERIAVGGFDASETAALVAEHDIGACSEDFIDGLQHATAGNPLFIRETLKSLSELDAAEGVVSAQTLRLIGVPEGAKDLIAQRVLRLAELAREVLAVACVVGGEFDVRVLEALLAKPADEIIASLEEAGAAGLVREADEGIDRFVFAHALVRDALLERHSTSRRVRLHFRIGEALELLGRSAATNPAELARHFYSSRHVDGGDKAIRYSVQAAEAAERALAHEDAAEHYRRALEVLAGQAPPDEGRRCDLLVALGAVERRQGAATARATFARAAELARRERLAEQLGRAALGFAGRYTEAGIVDGPAIALLEEALEALGDVDSTLCAELMARLADALHFADPGRTNELSLRALVMAREIGDTRTLVAALESRHTALLHIAHLDERLRLSEEFLELAEDVGERELEGLGLHWRIYDLLEASDVVNARREHQALAALATQLRQPLYQHFAVGWEVVWAQMAGRISESEERAREAFELGMQAQARDAQTVYAIQVVALRRREGRLSDQVAVIEAAIEKHPSLVAWRAVLPLAHLATGNHDEAVAEFERLAANDFAAVPGDMFWFTAMCILAETSALLGDEERAWILYEKLSPFRHRNVQVTQAAFWGSSERFLGLLAASLGRWELAGGHFVAAIAKNEANDCPVAAAIVRRDYAEMLLARREDGDVELATELLGETLRMAEAAGMVVLVGLLRSRLQDIERERVDT
jgi:tetratricopeptide (TPR) repeat protein